MKTRPILMSAPMVRALLEGRKTQTRRIIKPQPKVRNAEFVALEEAVAEFRDLSREVYSFRKCPYGKSGDLLWVREACGTGGYFPFPWAYRADGREYPGEKWTPSIHMPRRASRLTLELTGVRIEVLQAISDQDCFAEGIDPETDETYLAAEHYQLGGVSIRGGSPERCAYADLWESINGPGSWNANPYVWVLEFRVHQANVDSLLKARAA